MSTNRGGDDGLVAVQLSSPEADIPGWKRRFYYLLSWAFGASRVLQWLQIPCGTELTRLSPDTHPTTSPDDTTGGLSSDGVVTQATTAPNGGIGGLPSDGTELTLLAPDTHPTTAPDDTTGGLVSDGVVAHPTTAPSCGIGLPGDGTELTLLAPDTHPTTATDDSTGVLVSDVAVTHPTTTPYGSAGGLASDGAVTDVRAEMVSVPTGVVRNRSSGIVDGDNNGGEFDDPSKKSKKTFYLVSLAIISGIAAVVLQVANNVQTKDQKRVLIGINVSTAICFFTSLIGYLGEGRRVLGYLFSERSPIIMIFYVMAITSLVGTMTMVFVYVHRATR